MKCKICERRKARRYCPGVLGDICSICCGNEREVSIACPLECPYLQEAHLHEKPVEVDQKTVPNPDISVTNGFLRSHQELMVYAGFSLSRSAAQNPGVVDSDMREAIDALTRTYRTLSSGLYYDSHPVNPYADGIYTRMQAAITEFRAEAAKQGATLRDSELLGVLVAYQRMGLTRNNGRPKGRLFIGFLAKQFSAKPVEPEPTAPLISL